MWKENIWRKKRYFCGGEKQWRRRKCHHGGTNNKQGKIWIFLGEHFFGENCLWVKFFLKIFRVKIFVVNFFWVKIFVAAVELGVKQSVGCSFVTADSLARATAEQHFENLATDWYCSACWSWCTCLDLYPGNNSQPRCAFDNVFSCTSSVICLHMTRFAIFPLGRFSGWHLQSFSFQARPSKSSLVARVEGSACNTVVTRIRMVVMLSITQIFKTFCRSQNKA